MEKSRQNIVGLLPHCFLTDVNDISISSTEIQNENHQLCEIKVREWSLFPQATYLSLIAN